MSSFKRYIMACRSWSVRVVLWCCLISINWKSVISRPVTCHLSHHVMLESFTIINWFNLHVNMNRANQFESSCLCDIKLKSRISCILPILLLNLTSDQMEIAQFSLMSLICTLPPRSHFRHPFWVSGAWFQFWVWGSIPSTDPVTGFCHCLGRLGLIPSSLMAKHPFLHKTEHLCKLYTKHKPLKCAVLNNSLHASDHLNCRLRLSAATLRNE